MPYKTLVQVLMERDGMTREEVEMEIRESVQIMLEDNLDPDDVLREDFGLEPDYVFDLLEYCC